MRFIVAVIAITMLCIPVFGQTASEWLDKGNALADLGKYDEAIKAYDKAIELYPKDAHAWHNKGDALQRLGKMPESDAAYAKANELGYSGKPAMSNLSVDQSIHYLNNADPSVRWNAAQSLGRGKNPSNSAERH